MLFNSINYFLFLIAVFIINYILPGKFRWILLLGASIFFYAIAGAATIAVPFVIILSTFICGILIERSQNVKRKHQYFLVGVCINVGLLIFFKYVNFFIASFLDGISFISHIAGSEKKLSPVVLNIIVPLGISYITFQAIGYLIEVKRGNEAAKKRLGMFATYIMFFPKILSGPIERAHNFLPQLRESRDFNYDQVAAGLRRILWGLFLKLVVADRLVLYTGAVYDNYQYHTGITLIVAAVFFPIQLYADLGGYTAIAIGSAQVLGYKLMENFDTPFIAKTVSEFWRRWHISLTTWVNEYIYNPMVIKWRNWNEWGVVFGVIVTFLILGFWHGASWNFIIFGLLQGIILSIEFLSRKIRKRIRKKVPDWLNTIISMAYAYGYFCFSSIFFRANTAKDAIIIIKRIITIRGGLYIGTPSVMLFSIFGILVMVIEGWIYSRYQGRVTLFNNKNAWVRKVSYSLVIIIILLIGVFDGGQFIYFKF